VTLTLHRAVEVKEKAVFGKAIRRVQQQARGRYGKHVIYAKWRGGGKNSIVKRAAKLV
jgi:hypothetical protein